MTSDRWSCFSILLKVISSFKKLICFSLYVCFSLRDKWLKILWAGVLKKGRKVSPHVSIMIPSWVVRCRISGKKNVDPKITCLSNPWQEEMFLGRTCLKTGLLDFRLQIEYLVVSQLLPKVCPWFSSKYFIKINAFWIQHRSAPLSNKASISRTKVLDSYWSS